MRQHCGRLIGVAALLLSAGPAGAATPTDVLRDFFTQANIVIQTPEVQLSLDERVARVRAMANAVFDVRSAAADALGPEWQRRTPAEREQFAELFGDTLQRAYLGLVGLQAKLEGGFAVTFIDEVMKGDTATVRTTVQTRTNSTLAIDYRMARAGDAWMVVDAMVDRVSLVGTYRAQFSRVLQSYTYADLVEMMRAVAPESRRPMVALASDAVKPGDDVRVAPDSAPAPGDGASAPAPSEGASAPAPGEGRVAADSETSGVGAGAAAGPSSSPAAAGLSKGFWVELGAFDAPDLAARLLATLSDPAVAVFTPASAARPESLTRVLIGPFADRAAAEAKARELEAAGHRGVIAEE